MAAFNKFNVFPEHLAEKVHNLGSDALKVLFSNTAPSAANTVKADITEISAGGGYSAGGFAVSVASSGQSGGVYELVISNPIITFTASGAIGPARYLVLYNDSPTSPADPLIGWWDYGSAFSLVNGQDFSFEADDVDDALIRITVT